MCSDFQLAAVVSEAETLSGCSPIDVRCTLINARACVARSGCNVPQSAPGVQLLIAARAGAAVADPVPRTAARAAATIAALTNFPPIEPPEVSYSSG